MRSEMIRSGRTACARASASAPSAASRGLQRAEADLDGKFRAVLAPAKKLCARAHRMHLRIAEEPGAMRRVIGPEPLGHEYFDRLIEQLRARVSEQAFGLCVYEND